MKKLFLFLVAGAVTLGACNGANKVDNPANNRTELAVKDEVKTIKLDEAGFLAKVTDYKANPDTWKYLGDKPAIIDFYADWCGPCKKIAPMLEQLAKQYEGEVYIYKIDVDKESDIARYFGIRTIPSLLFVPVEGKPKMQRGVMPKEELEKAIHEVLLEK